MVKHYQLISITILIIIINLLDIKCQERESDTNITSTFNPILEGLLNQTVDIPAGDPTPGFDVLPYHERPLNCNLVNEIESNCSNSCPATCEDPSKPACRNNYCWRGCECKPGYVKEHQNWTCIPVELCPKCGPNEHFRDCGTNCEPTCSNYQNTPPHCNSHYSCKRGCFCNYGYVRDMSLNGTCVPIDKCPQKCGPNEYYEELGAPCLRTAANPRPKCLDEPTTPTCVCNTGYVRNSQTQGCEPLSTTHVEKCGGNETFSQCGTECARKCFDETKRHFCPTVCLRGCFCTDGYVRDSHNQRCVLSTDCYVWRPEIRRRRRRRAQPKARLNKPLPFI